MTETDVVCYNIRRKIRRIFSGEPTGHDFYHIERVVSLAKTIAKDEGADVLYVKFLALLHETDDPKLKHYTDTDLTRVHTWLNGVEARFRDRLLQEIPQVSWSKRGSGIPSLELKCVLDADRLEAIGAIGVARCFAYGGSQGRPLYDPNDLIQVKAGEQENPQGRGSSIFHFYEKLLLIRDNLWTESAKRLAESRHRFLESFLTQFFYEWENRA